jgi:hypothetical protein
MMGTDVIVLDPENEYRALVDTVGGTYLNISLNSNERINPFDLPRSLKDAETHPGDLLRGAVVNMIGLLRLMLGRSIRMKKLSSKKHLSRPTLSKGSRWMMTLSKGKKYPSSKISTQYSRPWMEPHDSSIALKIYFRSIFRSILSAYQC